MVTLRQIRTGLVADDFWWMADDDLSGRPRLSDRILAIGLAGALLCELALQGAVTIKKGDLVTTDVPPSNSLHRELCEEVKAEGPRPVRDWLDYLSLQAHETVTRRLKDAGLVYLQQPRLKVPGRHGRWLPVDPGLASTPAADVASKVYWGKADAHTLVLFGLTRATGLDNPSLWEIRHLLTDRGLLEQTLAPLVVHNKIFRDLLLHTEAAVGSAVASQRSS